MTEAARDPEAVVPPAARLIAGVARAEAAARARHDLVPDDLFRRDAGLSDYQRTTAMRLMRTLIDGIEADLLARIASPETPAPPIDAPLAMPALDRAGLLRDADLIALLLARADEHRLGAAIAHAPVADPVLLLAQDADAGIAGAAAALLVAQARRCDGFRDPVLPASDLPAPIARRLAWRVAAVLRGWLTGSAGLTAAAADLHVTPATEALLAEREALPGIDACATALIDRLADADRLEDTLITGLAEAANLPVLAAALARRAGLPGACAGEMVLAPGGDRLALLLRAAGIARGAAGAILLRFAPDEPGRIVTQLDAYSALDIATAHAALAPWRVDAAYRDAIALLACRPA